MAGLKPTFLDPQYILRGTCANEEQDTFLALHECTNATPWKGHPADSLYVSRLQFGGHHGNNGPFEIGFRERTATEGTFPDQQAIDYSQLPQGEWCEASGS